MTQSSRLCLAAVFLTLAVPAAAQAPAIEPALKGYFEGRRVTLKMDMPATSSGVDVHPRAERPINYKEYGDRLKVAGISLEAGDTSTVTLIKVKKDLIEFQIGGGGFGHDSGAVYAGYVAKSNREKQLEKDVKAEKDVARKRRLQNELDDLRNRREREQRRNEQTAKAEAAANKARIAQERLHAGSRFNLRYQKNVPADLAVDDVIEALSPYVDFNLTPPAVQAPPPAAPTPAGSALPRKGMSRADAEQQFGKPKEQSMRAEGGLTVATLVFLHGEQRISADFVEDILIRYTISSR
jgi:hypothetical protein